MLEKVLSSILCPFTILIRFVKYDNEYGALAFAGIVFWIIGAAIGWFAIAPAASLTFIIVTLIASYLLTHFFYVKIENFQSDSDFLTFMFYIMVGLVSGYTFGLLGFFFLLLY